MPKVSEVKFWNYLKANDGLYSKTAAAIAAHEGVTMSRQAVEQRAKKKPEKLAQVLEFIIDKAEDQVYTLASGAQQEHVKLKANQLILERKGRDRGWGEQTTIDINEKITETKKIQLSDVDPALLLKIKEQQKDNQFNKSTEVIDEE